MAESRPYAGPDDLRALQQLAQDVWRADRRVVDEGGTVGELAWGMGGIEPDDRRPRTAPAPREWEGRMWLRGGTVVAWATQVHAPMRTLRPRAVNLFALRRLRAAGAREATVACRGDPDYPIPKRLYESVGFRELSRQLRYITR